MTEDKFNDLYIQGMGASKESNGAFFNMQAQHGIRNIYREQHTARGDVWRIIADQVIMPHVYTKLHPEC